ncbi:CMRF35-like molecule 1 [Conger conger]|uniref:CMRF35-like molecule 1 n=1 Tax=Conger conger TaxID=82655 RepID=UPI002A5AEB63|nr:CMRF35-like molecule 1 [Conger conger]
MRLAFVLSFLTGAYSVSVWGPEKVISHTKGNVTVQCKYDKSYTDHVKYWCKVNKLIPCSKLVSTSEDTHSRITIRDNKTEGAFYITMTDLTKDDEGQYCCGIERSFALDEQALVHVQVNEDDTRPDLHGPVSVTGMASNSKTITAGKTEKGNWISAEKPKGSRNPNNRPIPGELKPAPECNGHKVEIHTRLVDNPSYDCFCIQDQKTPGG